MPKCFAYQGSIFFLFLVYMLRKAETRYWRDKIKTGHLKYQEAHIFLIRLFKIKLAEI